MSSSKSSPGLITTIIGVIFLWMVMFGITCGSTRHRLNCTTDRGVEINHEPAPEPAPTPIKLIPMRPSKVK
jgi:hypothetical protein